MRISFGNETLELDNDDALSMLEEDLGEARKVALGDQGWSTPENGVTSAIFMEKTITDEERLESLSTLGCEDTNKENLLLYALSLPKGNATKNEIIGFLNKYYDISDIIKDLESRTDYQKSKFKSKLLSEGKGLHQLIKDQSHSNNEEMLTSIDSSNSSFVVLDRPLTPRYSRLYPQLSSIDGGASAAQAQTSCLFEQAARSDEGQRSISDKESEAPHY